MRIGGFLAADALMTPLAGLPATAVAHEWHSSHHPPPLVPGGCVYPADADPSGGAEVEARTPTMVVSDLDSADEDEGDVFVACETATHRLHLITEFDGFGGESILTVRATGATVAYELVEPGDHYGTAPTEFAIGALDIRTGRHFETDVGEDNSNYVEGPVASFDLKSLVVGSTGAVAWLTVGGYNGTDTAEITVHDRSGARTVAQAPAASGQSALNDLQIHNDRTLTYADAGVSHTLAVAPF